KGVMVEQESLLNLLSGMQKGPGIEVEDVFLASTTYTFDISVLELFLPLVTGAKLVVAGEHHNPMLLQQLLEQEQTSIMQATPALWQLLLQSGWKGMSSLKVLCGGESLSPALALALSRSCGELWNMYGPTETTIWSAMKKIEVDESLITIGHGIQNTELYVLDNCLECQPVGITGDLYISGAGLTRGYLNNPALTAEKFIPHPFKLGERLYKTGDLARWLPDGNLEFLGRIDHQLKIHGYRIEAGEIEQALLHNPAIQSCVVTGHVFEQGKELVAYLVPKDNEILPDTAELRRFLATTLPDYMIPAYFVMLEVLPLTSSGKVDRKALPAPDTAALASGTQYVAPRNAVEETLAEIWGEVLGRQEIGIQDNFFHLGGHSLRAIQLATKVEKRFHLEWPLQGVFQHPILLEQAAQIQAMLTFDTYYTHSAGLRFNAGAPTTLFAFPAILGLAIGYQGLSAALPEVSIYSFDFLIEENRLERYYEQIKREQPMGPYLLFGYSAGGNLAFEMAAWMEARGEKITAVILADSAIRVVAQPMDWDDYSRFVEEGLQRNGDTLGLALFSDAAIRKKAKQRVLAYSALLNAIRMDTPLQSDIYLLKAEQEEEDQAPEGTMHQNWGLHTRRVFHSFWASGHHTDLFEGPHLEPNAALLKRIVEQAIGGAPEQEANTVDSEEEGIQYLWNRHLSLHLELLKLRQEEEMLQG
ncbi:MAG: hypothetical protein RIQ78_1462, partial [Bacteroidota bacterium]